MEKNEAKQIFPPRGDNTELEKFKRRLIRAVARMLLHEKRNEEEVWEGLRKQTGSDCKELWDRMHALTIRKLQRLLAAQDRVDHLPKPARMSVTDWLMFDTVIVHEDFDVIGMSETDKEDKKVIQDLFDIVEKFKIEFLAGDQLADAWSDATIHYNKDNRQCTPMLLQRRWYQFKLATRARFYKFWSMYKGTIKRLYLGEPYRPTPLQTKLALRYKPLVVKPFMLWEELIQHKLVILPEEFELKSIGKETKNEETAPEVMCIEPNVETIDLDDDSVPQKDKQPVVTIKQEPAEDIDIDESVPYENRQEKISHFAEAVMEATAMELDEIELADNVDTLNGGNTKDIENANDDNVVEIPSNEAEVALIEENDDVSLVTADQTVDLPANSYLETNALPNESDNAIEIIREEDNAVPAIENEMEKEIVLPQITSIFGGVDVSNESLSKIGLLTAQITNNASNGIIETDKRTVNMGSIDISGNSIDGMLVNDDGTIPVANENQIVSIDTNMEVDIKPNISNNTWFGELSNDIDFADDGIQLMDDGIAYVDDDCALQIGDIKIEIEEKEVEEYKSVENNAKESEPSVDKKLLMLPVVRTVKLDDMGILPIHLLQHVDNKSIIDVINIKSKPIVQKIKLKSESSDKDTVEEIKIKKVKLSSALLQKPRSRTYNPIQLCKNPDFNTRLKKLNVGFFSSARNRILLKACQPASVDVSKAFECRLVDGTMYLELDSSDQQDIHKNINLAESRENFSVLPSAMPAQSLIDNANVEIPPPIAVQESPIRDRIHDLSSPDKSEVNRNQRLLTVEVAPLNSKNDFSHVPVTIINTQPRYGKSTAGPASRTKLTYTPVVDITKEDNVNKTSQNNAPIVKNKEVKKALSWRPRPKPAIPWFSNKSYTYSSDTLLALDSLNKMLCLLTEGDKEEVSNKKNKKGLIKSTDDNVILVDDISTSCKKDDDVQVVGETKLKKASVNSKRKRGRPALDSHAPKRLKPVFCCWARERICQLLFSKKLISKHNCHFPTCMCCCRNALVEYLLKKKESQNSDIEKNTVEPLGCVGLGNLTGVAAKSIIDNDVAEIVPIDEITPKTSTSSSTETKEAKKASNENSANVVVRNTESTQTEKPILLDQDIDNNIEVGAETTVKNAETLVLPRRANATMVSDEQTNLNTTGAKPRIRVMASVRSKKLLEDPRPPSLDQLVTEQKKAIVIDATDPNMGKDEIVTVRRSLIPASPLKYKNIVSAPPKTIPIAPKLHSSSRNRLKQKMIYLNSKLISELPTDNPIFLGKNKILLTTAKFPANFKAFEAFQSNLKQTMALPVGIQLVLLPSGRLTYIRDRKYHVSDEFIMALPQLIEAVQQQIDATIVVNPNTLPEVINLSDDETEVVGSAKQSEDKMPKEIEQSKNPDDAETAKDGDDPTMSINTSIPHDTGEPPVPENPTCDKVDAEPIMTIDTSISHDIIETPVSEILTGETETATVEPEILTGETETATVEPWSDNGNTQSNGNIAVSEAEISTVNKESNDTKTAQPCSNDVSKEADDNILIAENETDTTANSENPNTGMKSKNILSDLMAMSGIEPTDITSTQEQAPELIPQEQLLSQEGIVQLPIDNPGNIPVLAVQNLRGQPMHVEHPIQARTPTNDNVIVANIPHQTLASSLTAITSLSELKYACAQCSSFFKLDIDTGMLHPINVCMKKFNEKTSDTHLPKTYRGKTSIKSSEPIDLTDDDVIEVVESTQTDDQNAMSNPKPNDSGEGPTLTFQPLNNKSLSRANSLTESDNININGINITSCGQVRPLKLFKPNARGRPSILGKKLKEIQKRICEAMTTQDMIRRKLKRKQELKDIATDEEMEVMTIDSNNDSSSGNSSDEEPLANIASKMRATEKIDAGDKEMEAAKEISDENATKSIEIEVPPLDKPTVTDALMNDEEPPAENANEEEESTPIEYLEETLLEENDANEDCILGF